MGTGQKTEKMQNGVIAHFQKNISLLPPPIVLKTVSSCTSLTGMGLALDSVFHWESLRKRGQPKALSGLEEKQQRLFFLITNLDPKPRMGGEGVLTTTHWNPPLFPFPHGFFFFFFGSSISALIKVCLPSKLFMSVFVFPHGIVNFQSARPGHFPPFVSLVQRFLTFCGSYIHLESLVKKLWKLVRKFACPSNVLHAFWGRYTGP